MKFIIFANAPTVQTGYGVQCAALARWLKGEGHDVAVACNFGHQVGVRNWESGHGPVVLYPQGVLENSIDIVAAHADHFFQGDRKAGWVIVINDVWALMAAQLEHFQTIAWTPVDHYPAPDGVVRFFHKTGAIPVAMSRFGEQMLSEAGLDPRYAPLTVDTEVFKPTWSTVVNGNRIDGRTLFNIPQDAFAVGMVAMNKDPQDRKGFNEAFRAFGAFWKNHQNAVLVVHTDRYGIFGSGINLVELAKHCAIPPHALIFTDGYAQRIGFSDEMLAALYTSMDVLVAPSKGEGFGVPMVEAQACGTPVIASQFTAQAELIGAGWPVGGQLEWDATQSASYLKVFHGDLFDKLEQAYTADLPALSDQAVAWAKAYDTRDVFAQFWAPVIAELGASVVVADKPVMETVDVIVPLVRDQNRALLMESFDVTAPKGTRILFGDKQHTYAENVNAVYKTGTADWVLIVGDDVEFTDGWFEAAQKLTDRYDVVGTNDTDGAVKNPKVASGSHADHFFLRRSYVDEIGSTLDGPGVVISEAYGHWFSDVEVIELAKARGVFAPCLESVIIHHHPGYHGDEDAREADYIYAKAQATAVKDQATWMSRVPLVQALRVKR